MEGHSCCDNYWIYTFWWVRIKNLIALWCNCVTFLDVVVYSTCLLHRLYCIGVISLHKTLELSRIQEWSYFCGCNKSNEAVKQNGLCNAHWCGNLGSCKHRHDKVCVAWFRYFSGGKNPVDMTEQEKNITPELYHRDIIWIIPPKTASRQWTFTGSSLGCSQNTGVQQRAQLKNNKSRAAKCKK